MGGMVLKPQSLEMSGLTNLETSLQLSTKESTTPSTVYTKFYIIHISILALIITIYIYLLQLFPLGQQPYFIHPCVLRSSLDSIRNIVYHMQHLLNEWVKLTHLKNQSNFSLAESVQHRELKKI